MSISARELRNRTAWRCRQGSRELEELLGGYLERRYDQLPAAEQEQFRSLVECSSADLNSWIVCGVNTSQEQYRELISEIRSHRHPSL